MRIEIFGQLMGLQFGQFLMIILNQFGAWIKCSRIGKNIFRPFTVGLQSIWPILDDLGNYLELMIHLHLTQMARFRHSKLVHLPIYGKYLVLLLLFNSGKCSFGHYLDNTQYGVFVLSTSFIVNIHCIIVILLWERCEENLKYCLFCVCEMTLNQPNLFSTWFQASKFSANIPNSVCIFA